MDGSLSRLLEESVNIAWVYLERVRRTRKRERGAVSDRHDRAHDPAGPPEQDFYRQQGDREVPRIQKQRRPDQGARVGKEGRHGNRLFHRIISAPGRADLRDAELALPRPASRQDHGSDRSRQIRAQPNLIGGLSRRHRARGMPAAYGAGPARSLFIKACAASIFSIPIRSLRTE